MFESLFFNTKRNNQEKNNQEENNQEEIICKLCHDNIYIQSKDFYAPCRCTGSVAYIHKDCFDELIKMETTCSICLTPYPPIQIVNKIVNPPPKTTKISDILDETFKKLDLICYYYLDNLCNHPKSCAL